MSCRKVRARKPEVYKGKGIKYETEVIRRKEGKTGAKSSCRRGAEDMIKKPQK